MQAPHALESAMKPALAVLRHELGSNPCDYKACRYSQIETLWTGLLSAWQSPLGPLAKRTPQPAATLSPGTPSELWLRIEKGGSVD